MTGFYCFLFIVVMSATTAVAEESLNIPLKVEKWQVLEYSSIKANKVNSDGASLTIEVNNSASPLIFPLSSPQRVKNIGLNVEFEGALKLKESQQGSQGNDDFLFRLGLVFEGEQTLGFLKRTFAPAWVKKLFSLAPEGTGVDHISFYNVYSDSSLKDTERTHPQSDLLKERFIMKPDEKGKVEASFPVNIEKRVLALWISSDGDDTASQFSATIKKLQLTVGE